MLTFAPHPLLHPVAAVCIYPRALGELPEAEALNRLHQPDAEDIPPDLRLDESTRETLRQDVRDLLRHGGHKPTGRGKPSAEYLVRAAGEGKLPRINAAVDVCNAVSLHSGLPISVVDLDRSEAPYRVDVPEEGSYVFNASGQEIRLDGLLCLFDATGPIANAVKDSHGTKTSPATTRTLSVLWAPKAHADHAERAASWYGQLVAAFGDGAWSRHP